MRRGSLRTGKRSADSGGEQGFWPTYADMMSTVALILFFLMLISYIQNLIVYVDDLEHLIARYILLFELPMASGRVI